MNSYYFRSIAAGVHRRSSAAGTRGPRRPHRADPEQRFGHGPVPQTTVVAVRPGRECSPGTRVHRAARRQVRKADRTHRPGSGRPATWAPGTADGPGHLVWPAAAKRASFRRRLPATVPAHGGVSGRIRTTAMTSAECCGFLDFRRRSLSNYYYCCSLQFAGPTSTKSVHAREYMMINSVLEFHLHLIFLNKYFIPSYYISLSIILHLQVP